MSEQGLQAAIDKMHEAELSDIAIASFSQLYREWEQNSSSVIPESSVVPLRNIERIADSRDNLDPEKARQALAKTAFLKLNGGLGTSMGLSRAKSLLPVRMHKGRNLRFIDIIIGQIVAARRHYGVKLPLIFLNSYRTSADTWKIIKRRKDFVQEGIPCEILQHKEPKIDAATGMPAGWPKDSSMEWCPPGHGDVFATLADSDILDTLEQQGIEYLFISNADNLGARPSATVAYLFERSGAPFMAEVARKTPADVKGGQIVIDKATSRLMLREMSQVPPEDMASATNIRRHPYFNTNNLWVRIDALKEKLAQTGGFLNLPLIVNRKTVDPTDSASTPVIQLETAMGAAIGQFDGAICIEVDRPRFLPVKKTSDLFIMRSDRFHMTDSYELEDGNYIFPSIELDQRYYKYIDDFNERFPYDIPSIAAANSVTIHGDWTFGKNVAFYGDALLEDLGKPSYVPNGRFVGPHGIEKQDWD